MLLSFPFSDIFYFLLGDPHHATVELDGTTYPATLVNLPTIIESTKTYDSRTFCKTGDISQVCVVHS